MDTFESYSPLVNFKHYNYRCKLQTPIKPDFLAFQQLYHLRYGLLDHVIKTSASFGIRVLLH
jgi:hypothetical protein